MIKLKSYASKTDQGPFLQINEDDVDVDLSKNFYSIYDGFGGSNCGDRAVRECKNFLKEFYGRISLDPNSTMPFFYSSKYLVEGNSLINSIHYAHESIKKLFEGKEMSEMGGASIIGVAQSENLLTFASVGNCMALLYRKGALDLITQPDCIDIHSDDPFKKPYCCAPISGIGLFEDIHLDIKELRIKSGDTIMLMTDGVYARLSLDEIKYVVQNPEVSDSQKIEELFSLSNSRGNLDNQSLLFLRY